MKPFPLKIAMLSLTHGHTRKYFQTLACSPKLDWVAAFGGDICHLRTKLALLQLNHSEIDALPIGGPSRIVGVHPFAGHLYRSAPRGGHGEDRLMGLRFDEDAELTIRRPSREHVEGGPRKGDFGWLRRAGSIR